MTEVAISVAAKVAKYLVAPITLPFKYFWNYKSNVENLENEVKKLEGRRDSVHHSVEDARKNGEEIEKHVETWLDSVKETIDEAWELINEDKHQQPSMRGCKGFSCSNLKKRYQHSRKAAKLKAVVEIQEGAGKFQKVSYHTIPEETWLQSSKGCEAFEARKSILKDIIDAFRNPDVNVVGIYGMGGIGKTTLAKEVAREAKKGKLFYEIVFVEVSQTPDIKRIQQEIADKLGLEFRQESVSGRASRLCERIKKEHKILLILDNIWERVDFEIVGIPSDNEHKGLKLLLTTRSYNVLTNEMDCQHNFRIESLNETDAWSLFKSIAGLCVDRPELQLTALNVAKECGGVPIAIVTIAKALRNKEIYEWNNALQELRNPSWKRFEGVTKEVYTSIKLSYNHLESEELKTTFLLCSSMGRTYDASIQDLLRYGIGMGLFRDINTMEQALDKVHTLVSKLKASSLLLDAPKRERFATHDIPDSERFAMHDVVCVVARSITSGNHHVFAIIDDVIPRYWIHEDMLKNCTAITLHNVVKFPGNLELVCPQLKFLYVKPKDSYLKISDNFFVGMPRLQVLHLIEMDLWPLPTSFGCLTTLQTLCLNQCKLKDIAIIGDLKKLEVLSFHGSEIEELPAEMRQLTMLRLLDLSYCSKLRVISPLVMSSLTHLESLFMSYASIEWDVARANTERTNASLDDLKHLTDLTTLEIRLPDVKLSNGLLFPKLERYKILIGDIWGGDDMDWHSPYQTSKMVKLFRCNSNEDGFISQLKGIRELELCGVPGVRNVLYDLDRSGFPELKHLHVRNNPDSIYIVDSKHSTSCNALESLELSRLDKLENICNGPLGVKSFDQLRIVKISFCNNLPNIFSFSNTQVLTQLEEIEVYSCDNMKEIFAIGGQDYVNDNEVTCVISLRQLCTVTLEYLPRLESFCSNVKIASPLQLTNDSKSGEIILEDELDVVKTFFNRKVVLPNLETLKIHCINVEKIWDKFPIASSCIQNLTRLIVIGCYYLKELFLSSMVSCFVQLQYLEIGTCDLLEEMVVMEALRGVKRRDTIAFPQLNCLKIGYLPKLKRLFAGNYFEFPLLKEFEMVNCPKFNECIFDHKVGFPTLEKIKLLWIHNSKMIWHSQLAEDSFSKLKSLEVLDCRNLLSVFPSSMCGRLLRLESLHVDKCASLEEIFDLQQIHYEERHSTAATQLRELRIFNLPNLKYVWNKDPQKLLSFGNLQKVEASGCQSLKNLFPGSVGRTLSELEYLRVSDCGLEEIVGKEGVLAEEEPARFLFPKLTFLELCDLPKLVIFHSGRHTVEWPVLKKLKLRHCGKLKIFTSEVVRIQGPNCSDKAFPCLEELELVGENAAMIWQGQVPECLFHELKILRVETDESKGLPLGIIQRFHNLEMLSLTNSSCKEIFSCGDVETQEGTPVEVKKLVLQKLDNLEFMWKQDFKLDLILQNLEVLKVTDCDSLISLVPTSASFQNLTILKIKFCKGLTNFMTSSTAKSLVHLIKMEILGCEKMTEVVGNQPGDVIEDKIVFSKLKSLSLRWLPSLTSFCSGNHILEFPSLEELSVRGCPNMKIFSQGILSMQALQEVEIHWEWIELSADVDLNKALQQRHEEGE